MTDLQKASQKAQEFRKREEEILERAQELFIAHGEDKVTVEMIADAVNSGSAADSDIIGGALRLLWRQRHLVHVRLEV